jgi:hypothetical protein
VGLSGAGEIAMSDVGAGSSGAFLDSEPGTSETSQESDARVAR